MCGIPVTLSWKISRRATGFLFILLCNTLSIYIYLELIYLHLLLSWSISIYLYIYLCPFLSISLHLSNYICLYLSQIIHYKLYFYLWWHTDKQRVVIYRGDFCPKNVSKGNSRTCVGYTETCAPFTCFWRAYTETCVSKNGKMEFSPKRHFFGLKMFLTILECKY